MNQQGAQVAIAPLAGPAQHRAAAARTMAWNQSEISRELAPAFELVDRSKRGDRTLLVAYRAFSSPIRICGPAMPKFDHTLSDARVQISSG